MPDPGVHFGKPPTGQAPIETPPKRSSTKTAAPRASSSTRSLKSEIAGLLMTINFVLLMIPPLSRDKLDMVEIDALAEQIDEECRQSAKFRKAVETALSAGSGAGLFGLIAIIGARRAARHGLIPAEADQELGNLLARGVNAKHGRDAAGVL